MNYTFLQKLIIYINQGIFEIHKFNIKDNNIILIYPSKSFFNSLNFGTNSTNDLYRRKLDEIMLLPDDKLEKVIKEMNKR